jgi:cyclophilin family peptidyl-prolyl cis-trans isomerase
MKINYFIMLIIAGLLSCTTPDNRRESIRLEIKKLEYARSNNLNEWKQLYEKSKGDVSASLLVLNSISKTRSYKFIPLIVDIIKKTRNDSLLKSSIFALGQIGTEEAGQALIELPYESFSLNVQKALIKSLGQCCTESGISFFESVSSNKKFANEILLSSAFCARKKLATAKIKKHFSDSISISNPYKELAYYYLYAAKNRDINTIIKMLPDSRGLTQKYLLKALYQKYSKSKNRFVNILKSDTLSILVLKTTLLNVVKQNKNWRNTLYALKLSPSIADSVFLPQIQKHALSKDFHLKIAALEACLKIDDKKALSFILSCLDDENDRYTKGAIINLLAQINSKMAYLFIMQNLDKGDTYFKELLLDALAKLKMWTAYKTLHQFIQVADARLANKAFENLSKLKRISSDDFNAMISSSSISSVTIAIDWKNEQKQHIPESRLFELYQKFNQPQAYDLQSSILKALKINSITIDDARFKILLNNSCHYIIRNKLCDLFPVTAQNYSLSDSLNFKLPQYLQPDSIIYYSLNPKVEIKTNKGTITAELFSGQAPLTVHHFLRLAGNNFYNGLSFHRVIADFVVQGGDPAGDGWGGPGYFIPSEDNSLPFKRGSIGMATSGFDTGGSQFFICQSEQPHLTGNYSLFGTVLNGMDVVDNIIPGDKILSVKVVQ